MMAMAAASRLRALQLLAGATALLLLPGCATMGSLMSPYPEKFDCKNDDHGQCIHPERAHQDAVAGIASRSDPAVTGDSRRSGETRARARKDRQDAGDAYGTYRDSVYRELKGLIEAPVTPMLKPAQTVRTLILPYADRQRPDRLYMPRYVYSILDKPVWSLGDMLVTPLSRAAAAPVLGQIRETGDETGETAPGLSEPHK